MKKDWLEEIKKMIHIMKCPKCSAEINHLIPKEPTDEGGAEFNCDNCRVLLYLNSPGYPDGKLEMFE